MMIYTMNTILKFTKQLGTIAAALVFANGAFAQDIDVINIDLLGNSSTINPVVHDSVLIFASDAKNDIVINYFNQEFDRLYQLYSVSLKDKKPNGRPKSFLDKSNRPYNQAAVAFDADNKMHITQNTRVESTIKGAPLAIFDYASTADETDGIPSEVKVRYANAGYPTYSQDGNLMIFVSDVPGGEGGTDLYYCEKVNGRWGAITNMGGVINTRGSEMSPFIHPSGKIFFASNGREDSKKLDIYYTYRTSTGFAEPVRFDVKINSMGDDYGFYYSDDEDWGYFTSNRHGKDKIYFFKQKFPTFNDENEYVEENYCYTFFEESAENYDPDMFSFKWTISDGQQHDGLEVDHCFKGPGDYTIALSVLDKTSGEELFTIAEYAMELRRPVQVNIHVPEKIKAGKKVTFTADNKYLTNITPKDYYWNFGNGVKFKGQKANVTFDKKGTYRVKCGTIADEDPSVRICTWIDVTVE